MADVSVGDLNSLIKTVNWSIGSLSSSLKSQASSSSSANAQVFQKTVRKSSSALSMNATDIGILARGITRLNVVSTLKSTDKVDFYKFKLTTKGDVGMGQVGGEGLRVQVMTRLGAVVADSNKSSGKDYESYKKLAAGELELAAGDYTIRVSREKGTAGEGDKNYAMQLTTGKYSKDYETVAQQPKAGDSPYQLSTSQQASISFLTEGASSFTSAISTMGQTGTSKLLGSFDLFI